MNKQSSAKQSVHGRTANINLSSLTSLNISENGSQFSPNWRRLLLNKLRTEFEGSDKLSDDTLTLNTVRRARLPAADDSAIELNPSRMSRQRSRKIRRRNRLIKKQNNEAAESSGQIDSDISHDDRNNIKKCKADDNQHFEKNPEITKCLALDCEFVGVGENGNDDMLARVSIVNLNGDCVYDKFVAPVEAVTDYRTHVSGVRPENLVNAEPLRKVQEEVHNLLKGKILVGHAVDKDLKVLFLSHPKRDIRDTSKRYTFRKIAKTKRPSLKKLASLVLGINIQTGEHDSVVDARATMLLYRTERKAWEKSIRQRKPIR